MTHDWTASSWKNIKFTRVELIIVLLTFLLLSSIGIAYHEIWLDEAQHFLLARDSDSFAEWARNCHNEGHPLLWDVILFLITRFSNHVLTMQIVHLIISLMSVTVICRIPFGKIEKLLIIFGYYIFYEYNLVCRNYSISVLFLLLLIEQYRLNRNGILRLAILVFFLSNTHLFSLLISMAFVLFFLIMDRKLLRAKNSFSLLLSSAIVLGGWLLSLYSILPDANYGAHFYAIDPTSLCSLDRFFRAASLALKGIFFTPDYFNTSHHFENSSLLYGLNVEVGLKIFLNALAWIIPIFILWKHPRALIFFLLTNLFLLPAFYFLPLVQGTRYFGFEYLIFISSCFLFETPPSRIVRNIAILIFSIQFINGIFMYCADIKHPFSEGKDVWRCLLKYPNSSEPVIILEPNLRPAISAYACMKLFGIENGIPSSFRKWELNVNPSIQKEFCNLKLKGLHSCLVIVHDSLQASCFEGWQALLLKSFREGMVEGENADIFLLTRKK